MFIHLFKKNCIYMEGGGGKDSTKGGGGGVIRSSPR